jgi:hypothetical protein
VLEPTLSDLHTASPVRKFTAGDQVKDWPFPITTSSLVVGTAPSTQFEAVFQSPRFELPFQVRVDPNVLLILINPIINARIIKRVFKFNQLGDSLIFYSVFNSSL